MVVKELTEGFDSIAQIAGDSQPKVAIILDLTG